MDTTNKTAVVGVFDNQEDAQRAVQELKRMGFRDDQIGVAQRDTSSTGSNEGGETYASTGALAGVATGAGVGALWGLGIAAGMLPAIGPVIAGGTLAAILASAATGAAAAGIVGALVGMGIPEEEAKYYESELHSGRTVVTVTAGSRYNEARMVLDRFHGYDMQSRESSRTSGSATGAATTGATSGGRKNTAQSGDTQKIQLREEELNISKRPVDVGEVQVHKEVHTEQRNVQVPVKREEIVIERHAASGQQPASEIGRDEEIRIPVREEQVQVDKRAVVKEEVTVGKRQVQETKEVADTVRKEEVRVDKKGDVDVKDNRRRKE